MGTGCLFFSSTSIYLHPCQSESKAERDEEVCPLPYPRMPRFCVAAAASELTMSYFTSSIHSLHFTRAIQFGSRVDCCLLPWLDSADFNLLMFYMFYLPRSLYESRQEVFVCFSTLFSFSLYANSPFFIVIIIIIVIVVVRQKSLSSFPHFVPFFSLHFFMTIFPTCRKFSLLSVLSVNCEFF